MTEDINEQQAKEVLKGISIPPQPKVLLDIKEEQQKDEPNMSLIADLISTDVGLSGGVLKTINSPFFGMSRKITSVKQAVMLLGHRSVANIVTGLSLRGSFDKEVADSIGPLWDCAMNVGNICALFGKQLKIGSSDELYTLGLFHNIGKVLLLQKHRDYLTTLQNAYNQPDVSITDFENSVIASNHAVVGYFVAKAWLLPMNICKVIRDHHSLYTLAKDKYYNHEVKQLLALLKLAEFASNEAYVFAGNEMDCEWPTIKEHVLEILEINEARAEEMKDDAMELMLAKGV